MDNEIIDLRIKSYRHILINRGVKRYMYFYSEDVNVTDYNNVIFTIKTKEDGDILHTAMIGNGIEKDITERLLRVQIPPNVSLNKANYYHDTIFRDNSNEIVGWMAGVLTIE